MAAKKKTAKKKIAAKKKKTVKKKKVTKKDTTKKTVKKRSSKVSKIVTDVQGQFSNELIKTLSHERVKVAKLYGISWGCVSLNYICTGNPFVGIIPGRIYEIFGKAGSGKTTACIHAIVCAQSEMIPVAFIDAEHALNLQYSVDLGVNLDELVFSQPDYGEQGIDIAIALIKAGIKLVVVDSVAGLTPKAIIEGNMEKAHMALSARMMGQALQKLTVLCSKHKASILFINQVRTKPGVVFGNPEYTPGGKALKFYSSFRLEFKLSSAKKSALKGATGTLLGKKEKERIGSILSANCIKNKLWKPFQDCEMPFFYGKGIDSTLDLYDFALNLGIIKRGKGHYKVGDKKVGYANMGVGIPFVMSLLEKKWEIVS